MCKKMNKSLLLKALLGILIVCLLPLTNFKGLKVKATATNYNVTIWTTDINFVRGVYPYIGDDNYLTKMKNFYEGLGASSNIIGGGHLSSDSLKGTNLLWVFLPNIDFTSDDISYMKDFLETGGRIVFCGEHPGFFPVGDGYINKAIKDLGGKLTITSSMHSPTSGIAEGSRISQESKLAEGLTGFYYAAAAKISYEGPTDFIINALDDQPLVAEQAVGKGRITLLTDINTWDPVLIHELGKGNNEIFFMNLVKDAKVNQDMVSSGKNPNLNFRKLKAPTANFADGSMVVRGSEIKLNNETSGADIYYTTDLSVPNEKSAKGNSVILDGEVGSQVTLKAIAMKSGMQQSDVATFKYTLTAPPTTIIKSNIIDKEGQAIKQFDMQVVSELNGTKTVMVKSQEALQLKKPDGVFTSFSDFSKVGFSLPYNVPTSNASILMDGTIKIKNLMSGMYIEYDITYDLGGGQKIIIGKIILNEDMNGNVSLSSTLIDPYGNIKDSVTEKAIGGADVTLYYANTDRNKAAGKAKDSIVVLPIIEGFQPNSNKNPQESDTLGSYAFMVYPNTDYYVVVKKEGYKDYISPVISVENQLIKHDIQMTAVKSEQPASEPTTKVVDKSVAVNGSELAAKDTKVLPKTGTFIDATLLIDLGILLIIAGSFIVIKRKDKCNIK